MLTSVDIVTLIRYGFNMPIVDLTPGFANWLENLRDRRARQIIIARIERAGQGNFGDWQGLGGGLSEMRIDHGPGYRLYFTRQGNALVILLNGGDKSSQQRDITRARAIMKDLDNGN